MVLDRNRGDLDIDVLTKQVLAFDGHGLELGRVRVSRVGGPDRKDDIGLFHRLGNHSCGVSLLDQVCVYPC